MSLPLTRNRTYAAGSQVFSADLNAIQDQIIALNTAAHGTRTLGIPSSGFSIGTNGTTLNFISGLTTITSATDQLYAPIPLAAGSRILAVRFFVTMSAGTTVNGSVSLSKRTTVGQTSIAGAATSGTGLQTITLASVNHTLTTGGAYDVHITNGDSSMSIHYVEIDYDRP
jgi:hypothetical protein